MLIASGVPAIWPLFKCWLERSAAFKRDHSMPLTTPDSANEVAAGVSLVVQAGKRMDAEST